MRSAYIYYRVAPDGADAASRSISALMRRMQAHCGKTARLLRRCDDPGTWMEIYEDIEDWGAFLDTLRRAEAECLDDVMLRARRLECFRAHDACP